MTDKKAPENMYAPTRNPRVKRTPLVTPVKLTSAGKSAEIQVGPNKVAVPTLSYIDSLERQLSEVKDAAFNAKQTVARQATMINGLEKRLRVLEAKLNK